uniref:Uncharacterized protein n=1 Tax=Avena sativa TaxID=4498 RepID=A0ACD5WB11_AVESA
MWSSDSDGDESVSTTTTVASSLSPPSSLQPQPPPPPRRRRNRNRRRLQRRSKNGADQEEDSEAEAEAEEVWCGAQWEAAWPRRAARPVVLAGEDGSPDGTAAGAGDPGVGRARSLTDDDLEELKGCVDLGFGFSYTEIPELCGTLPALELCYSMSQRFLDEHSSPPKAEQVVPEPTPAQSIPNWKISCPGDSPEEVKARLKYWAQAVACTVKL